MNAASIIQPDFLLESPEAILLYEQFAKDLPIIDYHSHLPPDEIASNKQYENLTEIWLKGDHYKWRAMRALGVEERFITGEESDFDKFQNWAAVVPYTLRNPLFHWTHMELNNPFGIRKYLHKDTATDIYRKGEELLQQSSFSAQGILRHFNVEMVGTTDDPIDTLTYHKSLKIQEVTTRVVPSFRPDKVFALHQGDAFRTYIYALSDASGITISDLDSLCTALDNRLDHFESVGCKIADHGLSTLPTKISISLDVIDSTLKEVLNGNDNLLSDDISNAYTFHILTFLSKSYNRRGWVQQFHLGALRNNNKRLLTKLGADTGFDSIGDYTHGESLSNFLNHLDSTDELAKTIIYNLNPADNALFATMVGNFPGNGMKSKVQFGAAWWYNDQLDGMKEHINTLSNLSTISTFVGMLTDSRSFLSYSRHEYFRRLICNIFAEDIRKGLIPRDLHWTGMIISDICYYNAKRYFSL